MKFEVGQGILAKIRFKDGVMPSYSRTYLVVEVGANYIKVLNVSSTKGKEEKAQRRSNEVIKEYEPPFKKPSFVKLDSLAKVDNPPDTFIILHKGEKLNPQDLDNILSKMNSFNW
jgi:hypothetical protein